MGRVKISEQNPNERINNFEDVVLGYTEEEAIAEAKRCIQCKKPRCMGGCPVEVRIPEFIKAITEGEFIKAADIIEKDNQLGAICGRVCPQEEQCEKVCILGIKGEPIAIGKLERFASDYKRLHSKEITKNTPTKDKVAVIGSGPAGLTAAADLAKMGYKVTLFEAFHEIGGVLVYGIPEFRLPKEIVKVEEQKLKNLGVIIEKNVFVGRTVTIEELKEEGFKAIFIGTGAGLPRFMGIEGENLNGVYSANEYLTRINLMKAYKYPEHDTPVKRAKKVCVIGGGNVAMDCARSARRMGAEVQLLYRRTEKEMPARNEEIHHAKEEGIKMQTLVSPVRINGKDRVESIECIKMELGEPDSSGRARPIPIDNSEFVIDAEVIIVAVGTRPNPIIAKTTADLKTQKWGGIEVFNEAGLTSIENVYAGGDAVTGAATVILAMGAGKNAAKEIDRVLSEEK